MKSTLLSLFFLSLVFMIPFTSASQTCLPPSNLTATSISSSGAVLSWTGAAGSTMYIVQYHAPGGAWINATTQASILTLTNLTCGTAYEWHVAALCSNGGTVAGPYSTAAVFTTFPCPTNCPIPSGLTTGNVGPMSATLSWNPTAGAVAYAVQYHAPGGAWINLTSATSSITITTLTCGTTYEWHVATICSTVAGNTSPYSAGVSFTTTACTTACDPPSGLTASSTASGTTLEWTAPAGAFAYIIQYHAPGGAWVTVTSQANHITLTNLACGTVYEWHVAAYCNNNTANPSAYSATASFTTLACTPTCLTPMGPVTTNINATGATFSWTVVTGALAYIVQYHPLSPAGSAWIDVTTQTTSVTLTNLVCGTFYEWHVATVCSTSAGGTSVYTTPLNFTTTACTTTCAAPISLTAGSISATGATLEWAAVTGATGYIVQYHSANGAWINVTTQTNHVTLANLTCGTVYEWHVATLCANGTTVPGPYSAVAVFTTLPCTTPCPAPTGLAAGSITTTGATLEWTAPAGAFLYIVQYHAPGAAWVNVTTQTNHITLTGLTCGTAYEWHVAAYCGNNTSTPGAYSATVSFTTAPCPINCITPSGLTTGNISATGATFEWTAVTGAAGYIVQYHAPGGAWINVTTQANHVTLTNLTCGTTYEWHVASVCGSATGNTSPYSAGVGFTTLPCTTACPVPTGLTAGNITTTGATLEWIAATGANAYIVQYHSGNGAWIDVTTQTNHVTLTNLTCGTVYEWHVATICSTVPGTGNTSPYSATAVFTTLPCTTACPAPTGLASGSITTTGATLEWVAATGGNAYIVQYHSPGGAWIDVTTQTNHVTLTNLTCGTAYEWHVATICSPVPGGNTSPYSATAVFTTLPCTTACPAPTGLTAGSITTTGATLEWTGPAGAFAYIVQYHSPGGAWVNVTSSVNHIPLTNLTCGTVYEWHVAAYCNNNTATPGAYSLTVSFTTAPCATNCVTPSGLTTGNISASGATLEWTAVTGAAGYIVQYHAPGGAWINVTTQASHVTLTNLTCGTTYEWHVASVCGSATGNTSPYSAGVSFTTLPCTPTCVAPAGLTTTNISATGATLEWVAAAGSVAYIVQYHSANGAWINVTAQTNHLTLTNLTCGTIYEWHVAALCNNGTTIPGPYSTAISFTTLPCTTTCPAPGGLATTDINPFGATLSWSASAGAAAYIVQYHIPGGAWVNVTTQTNHITLTNLTCATVYEWHVAAYCGSAATNISPYSPGMVFTTLPCTTNVCPVPVGLTSLAISATGGSRMLTWSPTNAVFYNIRYRIVNTATWSTTTSNTNTKLITGLQAASHYEWQVQSVCTPATGATSVSAWSASAFFDTPTARMIYPNPASGRSIQVPVVTENEARISIIISDHLGKTITTVDRMIASGAAVIDVDIANLSTGIYFVRVMGGNANEVQKLIITR